MTDNTKYQRHREPAKREEVRWANEPGNQSVLGCEIGTEGDRRPYYQAAEYNDGG